MPGSSIVVGCFRPRSPPDHEFATHRLAVEQPSIAHARDVFAARRAAHSQRNLELLVGWGIPEERVKPYESGIKEGGIVMGVNPRSDEDAEYFEREWKNSGGQHVYR